ncbi:MAG: iron ABC transporter permease, partial [Verrucomicrobiota bacterium]
MRPAARGPDLVWLIASVLISTIILVPLAAVILGLGRVGPMWEHMASTVLSGYVVNTIVLVVLVALLSLALALPAAWFVSIFDFPGRRFFEWALVLPLAIPTYVAAFVYIQVPEAAIPLLVAIRKSLGVDAFQTAEVMIRYGVLSLLLAAVLYPYIYITARASFPPRRRRLR